MKPEDISAGARTVAHMAVFFDELKAAALELTHQIPAQERGYFTPQEEERARALLVSYAQARNALFELIWAFQRDTRLDDPDRPAAFLVAFAAAVILVDAGRSLRELFDEHGVVRRKLNEPAPEFGIAAGTYDQVQQSLLSARHAWHLYYALQYFEEHQAELERLAAGGELAPALATIDRLRHRLDIPMTQFARAKLRTRGGQVARNLAGGVLGRAIYGLQKLASSMMADVYVRRGHQPRIPDDIAAGLSELLLPGDVLVVRKEYAVTNYFLPGYWPHAALYLGRAGDLQRMGIAEHDNVRPRWAQLLDPDTSQPRRVFEAMKDGVLIRPLDSPFRADSVVVLRPRLDPDGIAAALAQGLVHEGKAYDFDFDFSRSDRLVCTEVVYRTYEGVGPVHFDLTRRAGRLTLSGSDLIADGRRRANLTPVAVFAPAFDPEILTGSSADEVLDAAGPPSS